jgi:hypothetical protein
MVIGSEIRAKRRLSSLRPVESPVRLSVRHLIPAQMRMDLLIQATMTAILHRDCSRFVLGAFLALLVGTGFAPSRARAGCGDHLPTHAWTANSSSMDLPSSPAKKDCACTGPHCARSPLAPIPTPSVPGESSAQEWAYLLPLHCLLETESLLVPWDKDREFPLVVAADVYHPPR